MPFSRPSKEMLAALSLAPVAVPAVYLAATRAITARHLLGYRASCFLQGF